jgi:hypothetical protein
VIPFAGDAPARRDGKEGTMNAPNYPTIHYTELPLSRSGEPLEVEWNTYVREVGRLLGEGKEGKWVLIKGDQIIGLFDTDQEASGEGYRKFLRGGFLIHQIQTRERLYRGPRRYLACPTSH